MEERPRTSAAPASPVAVARVATGTEPSAPSPASTAPAPPASTAPPAPAKRSLRGSKIALEWVILVVVALAVAVLVKAFLFQAFYIPSDSMLPTLRRNDRVIVNKLSYDAHAIHRGDIVVFTTPKGPDGKPIDPNIKDLVKRVIGLPGDTISEKDEHILVNGKPIREPYLRPGTVSDCASFRPQCFPTDALPAGRYWVMGDNRPNSQDSRYFGTIDEREIVGRVSVRIWPLNRLGLL